MKLRRIAKALTGMAVAGLTALGTAMLPPDQTVRPPEWVAVALASVVALGAVWRVPNTEPDDVDRALDRADTRQRLTGDAGPNIGAHRRLGARGWDCPQHGISYGTRCCGQATARDFAPGGPVT